MHVFQNSRPPLLWEDFTSHPFFFLKKHEINRTVGKKEGCGLVNGLRGVDLHRWYTSLGWGWLPATIQQHFLTPPNHLTSVVGFRTGSLPFALSDDTLAVNLSLRVQYHLSSLASTWSHIQDDYFSFWYPQLWGFGMPTSIFLTYPPHTVLSMYIHHQFLSYNTSPLSPPGRYQWIAELW